MTLPRTALFLALALSAGTAFAQQDVSKVNGSVTAEAGQAYGDLETVNGSIRIGAGAQGQGEEQGGAGERHGVVPVWVMWVGCRVGRLGLTARQKMFSCRRG